MSGPRPTSANRHSGFDSGSETARAGAGAFTDWLAEDGVAIRGEGITATVGLLSMFANWLANCRDNYSVRTAVHAGWSTRCSVAGTGNCNSCTTGALSAMELPTGPASVHSLRSSIERVPTPRTRRVGERLTTHSIGTATRRPVRPYAVMSRHTRCEIGSRTRPSTCPINRLPNVISAPTRWASLATVELNMTATRPRFVCCRGSPDCWKARPRISATPPAQLSSQRPRKRSAPAV
jgi:hypothetical protein